MQLLVYCITISTIGRKFIKRSSKDSIHFQVVHGGERLETTNLQQHLIVAFEE